MADRGLRPTPAQLAEALDRLGKGHTLQPGFSVEEVCAEDRFLYLAADALDADSYYAIDIEGKVVTGPGDGRIDEPSPRAEVCRRCGNHIRTVAQRCIFDGRTCST